MPAVYSIHPDVTLGMIAGKGPYGPISYPEALGASPKLQIFDGVMPATAGAALSGNNKLAELVAAAAPIDSGTDTGSASRAVWAPIASATALLTGEATFCRTVTNDGTKVIDQFNIGESGSEAAMILSTVDLTAGSTVAISSRTSDLDHD